MQNLNVQTVPLRHKNLIEASAGTGKTWTLSFLYLRLILQEGYLVSQILVVTYTNAATDELRDRIRQRLVEAKQAFQQPHEAQAEYLELLANTPDHALALQHLQRAILSFDESAVFTIHGFCQRALVEQAFEAGLPFEHELIADDAELQQALVDGYWRQQLQQASDAMTDLLVEQGITPDSLLAGLKSFVGKPYLKRVTDAPAQAFDELYASYQQAEQRFIQQWQQHSQAAMALLKEQMTQLNGNKIRDKYVDDREARINAWIAGKSALPLGDVEKFTQSYIKGATKKKAVTPEHELFAACEVFCDVAAAYEAAKSQSFNQLCLAVLQHLQQALPPRKRHLGVLSFDDLLLSLQAALQQQAGLSGILFERYPVALIDEFQDTDPVQFDVFERIYTQQALQTKGALFFVGDPKQAIYSFRGADIFTYLKAARAVDYQYTLGTNYRSHPKLIEGLNHLYAHADQPFQYEQIQYQAVKAGKGDEPRLITPAGHKALHLQHWQEEEGTKAALMAQIADAVAHEIAVLLMQAQQGEAYVQHGDHKHALQGGDFAVLVRSHKQGQLMKQALNKVGIASVQQSPQSIFNTLEATELQVILRAIIAVNDEGYVRFALVTSLLNYTADDLLDFSDRQWNDLFDSFYQLQQLGIKQGFMPMFQAFLHQFKIREQLLNRQDGERRLTNVLHLGELLHQQDRQHPHGLPSLLAWLKHQSDHAVNDASQLRLESDDNLVQIVTIHKSKGLEYPLVYCPFLWADQEKGTSDAMFMFHHPETNQACLEAGSAERERWRQQYRSEEAAENQRLLYVAVTRPRFHCSIVLVSHMKAAFSSAVSRWLFSSVDVASCFGKKATADPVQLCNQHLQTLVNDANDSIASLPLQSPEQAIYYQATTEAVHYQARQFDASYQTRRHVSSFTAMVSSGSEESYEHHDIIFYAADRLANHAKPVLGNEFPSGARAGSCLHEMLEHLDFQQALDQQTDDIIKPILQKWGYETDYLSAAVDLLNHAVQSPLQQGFCLKDLSKPQRLDEMAFHFSIERLQVDPLKACLLAHLPSDWQEIRAACQQLRFADISGYMKGYIDLVYERDGRYGVMDYKSNRLADYGDKSLHQAMAHAHYYLQYLIYCVALHRYLAQRIPDYAWERHSAGVHYLFLRGMNATANIGDGVFFHQPSAVLVKALDELIDGKLSHHSRL